MVDGVVLLNVAYEDARLPVMRKMRQPGAMVGLPRDPDGFDVFDLDFAEAGRILVDHLAERGHREVILITPREHVYERGGAYAWRFSDAALAAGGQLRHPGPLVLRRDAAARHQPAAQRDPRRAARRRR